MRSEARRTAGPEARETPASRRNDPGLTHARQSSLVRQQRGLGNQAFGATLRPRPIQAKLKAGAPNDGFEQEADRVADQVMPCPQCSGADEIQMKSRAGTIPPLVQRQELEEEEDQEETIQTKAAAGQHGPLGGAVEGESPEEEEVLQGKFTAGEKPAQLKRGGGEATNRTGMTDRLKVGLETLSGMDLSGIQVHTNSSKPAQINALAYAQGQDIYVGPGQERHLPHEGWHVVQQMQGRVSPTIQAKGVSIKDDTALEREADVMGARALEMTRAEQATQHASHARPPSMAKRKSAESAPGVPVQRQEGPEEEQEEPEKEEDEEVLQGKFAPGDSHETEADRTADAVLRRLGDPHPDVRRRPQAPASGMNGLGAGRSMSVGLRRRFEGAFNWDFSGVRLHTGSAAAAAAADLGARAFTRGRDVAFGNKVDNPEGGAHRRLLAHELSHVVQQDMGAGARPAPAFSSLSPAPPARVQAAPNVTAVATSAAELGVGGRDITATATVAGRGALTWTINPGGVAPAGVSVIGRGRRVRIRAAQPGAGVVVGGAPIVIRAELTGSAPPDGENSPPVTLVQVVSANYVAAPPLAAVPSLIPGAPPPNTAEPNRDGIAGNTAVVNAVTAPAGRPVNVRFRRSLRATLAGLTITPGRRTGDIRLRITDTATRARLDETQPSAAGPAARMAELTVNAVPRRVSALARAGVLGPYGVLNAITFASSDNRHPPLTRIVGELITHLRDDFNVPPPNGAFNPAFLLGLAVPANAWNDQLITPAGTLNVADGLPAIDVNRFVGPGVPRLPRRLIYRQRFQYASWQGAGAVVSNTIADGRHIRSLIGRPGAFRFRTEHRFGGVRAPRRTEPYVGNPLIVLSNVVAAPTAAGATALAADGVATANLTVTSSVPGRTVNWTVRSGDIAVTAGNPAVLPAAATLRAGVRSGRFRVRAADSVFPNRRINARVRVAPVRLRRMRPALRTLPAGTLATTVNIIADPGGRTVNWAVDAAAAAAGVTVAPGATGPGAPAMNVTVTRPAGFTGIVTVTATDSVLAARTRSVRIRMR